MDAEGNEQGAERRAMLYTRSEGLTQVILTQVMLASFFV